MLDVEDDKISLDELQEEIQEFEDYVQSTDVAAMQSESNLVTYRHFCSTLTYDLFL